jgi:hypothetical protein
MPTFETLSDPDQHNGKFVSLAPRSLNLLWVLLWKLLAQEYLNT